MKYQRIAHNDWFREGLATFVFHKNTTVVQNIFDKYNTFVKCRSPNNVYDCLILVSSFNHKESGCWFPVWSWEQLSAGPVIVLTKSVTLLLLDKQNVSADVMVVDSTENIEIRSSLVDLVWDGWSFTTSFYVRYDDVRYLFLYSTATNNIVKWQNFENYYPSFHLIGTLPYDKDPQHKDATWHTSIPCYPRNWKIIKVFENWAFSSWG